MKEALQAPENAVATPSSGGEKQTTNVPPSDDSGGAGSGGGSAEMSPLRTTEVCESLSVMYLVDNHPDSMPCHIKDTAASGLVPRHNKYTGNYPNMCESGSGGLSSCSQSLENVLDF